MNNLENAQYFFNKGLGNAETVKYYIQRDIAESLQTIAAALAIKPDLTQSEINQRKIAQYVSDITAERNLLAWIHSNKTEYNCQCGECINEQVVKLQGPTKEF